MADTTSIILTNPHDAKTPFICVSLSDVAKMVPSTYLPWSMQCEAILDGYDLFKYPNGAFPAPPKTLTSTADPPVTTENAAFHSWRRQDKLVYGALLSTLSPTVASLVAGTTTSHELWTQLQQTYAKPSRGHIQQLKSKLRSTTMGSLPVTEFMHFLKATADMLAVLGSPVHQEDLTDYILKGLDDSFKPIIDAINARDSPISFEELLEKLLRQELRNAVAKFQELLHLK